MDGCGDLGILFSGFEFEVTDERMPASKLRAPEYATFQDIVHIFNTQQ